MALAVGRRVLPNRVGLGHVWLHSRCNKLRTSGRLLNNRTPFQLEFAENIAGVPLTLSKNVLEFWLLATFGDIE
jgi:hypothetical protein